ncbi:MAG: crotonase/enoyl-CoA hydratase family protein [Myxococcales bacterium]|nr:crotonase/enoyl-CoA hydratase family protein [Myxococcales bacterium]
MSDTPLKLDRDGAIAWVTLNRPDKLNAMGPAFWDGMAPLFDTINDDHDVRVAVIRGAGRAFSSGLDLVDMMPRLPLNAGNDGAKKAEMHRMIRHMQGAVTCVERCRVPVIAAVHGACIGGAIDLITACDIRLAAADAVFSVRETRIGMVADIGTLQRLPAIVGPGIARELVFTGRDVDAAYAERVGLVDRVLPSPEALFDAAGALATEIAEQAPLAVQGAKRVMVEQQRHEIDRSLEYVATWNAAHLVNQDLMAAMAAMAAGAPPKFEGR